MNLIAIMIYKLNLISQILFNGFKIKLSLQNSLIEYFSMDHIFWLLLTGVSWLFLISLILILISKTKKLKKANQTIKENARFISDQNEEIKVQFDILKRKNIELNKYHEHLEKIDKKMAEKLNVAIEKAKESERLKSNLISNIYHEIRTPLNAIIGFVQLLSLEEELINKKYIDIIEKNADDLLSLVDNLIELSNLQAGINELKVNELKVKDFLDKLYQETIAIRNVQKKNHLDIRLDFYDSIEFDIIRTDSLKLYKIIRQIIENALKYTKEGCISIGYFKTSDSAYFTISDTGIGIREDRISSIFNPFLKIEDQPNLYRGMGIGLTVAKHLTDIIKGEIKVESKLNEGTKFTIKVPHLNISQNKKPINKKSSRLAYVF
jgi:signal transduction histidine kinase